MRTYSTLTKKQLVKWLNNFDDDTRIATYDDEGNTVFRIQLYEGVTWLDGAAAPVLNIYGRQ